MDYTISCRLYVDVVVRYNTTAFCERTGNMINGLRIEKNALLYFLLNDIVKVRYLEF